MRLPRCCRCKASSAAAAAGELDRSFGGTGVVELAPGPSGETAIGFAVGPQSESLVLEKGFVCKGNEYGINGCGAKLFLSRYAANGSRDVAFGERARAAGLEVGNSSQGASVAVDRQGRPMLAALNQGQLEVVRLLSNGERDPSFGNGGKVERICGCESSVADIAVDASGRIVVRLRSDRVTHLIRFLPSAGSTPVSAAREKSAWKPVPRRPAPGRCATAARSSSPTLVAAVRRARRCASCA